MLNRRWALENSSHNKHGACSMKMFRHQETCHAITQYRTFFAFSVICRLKERQNLRLMKPIYFSGFQESLPNLLLLIFAILVTVQSHPLVMRAKMHK